MCLRFYNEKNSNLCLCFSFYIKKQRSYTFWIFYYFVHIWHICSLCMIFIKKEKYMRETQHLVAFFLWEKHEYRLYCAIFEIFQLFVVDLIFLLEMLKKKNLEWTTLKKETKFSNLIIGALSETRLKWTLGPAHVHKSL